MAWRQIPLPVVVFECRCDSTVLGEHVHVIGSSRELGSWQVNTHTQTTHTHLHTHTHTRIHTQTCIHTQSCIHTHTQLHTHTHRVAYTHIELDTHTQVPRATALITSSKDFPMWRSKVFQLESVSPGDVVEFKFMIRRQEQTSAKWEPCTFDH